jgi:hypothetical protein
MKVNMTKLGSVIQKATFNYKLHGANIHFEKDKITSKMISANFMFLFNRFYSYG